MSTSMTSRAFPAVAPASVASRSRAGNFRLSRFLETVETDLIHATPGTCAGYLGYPFSNKKRKSHITPLSLATYTSDGEEMELLELSFTHFWNGYPQEHIQEEMAAVALVSPPGWEAALSQMLPSLFRRVPLRSDLATSCWKAHCWLVRAIYEEDGSRVHNAGTRVVPGDGKPPHFCLECRRLVCVNPRSIRLAAFSRPRSRCSPL